MKYLSEGSYEEAIIAFTAAIEIDPKRPEAYVGRGDAYVGSASALEAANQPDAAAERYASAEADFLEALSLEQLLPQVYEKLANIYLALGLPEKAVAILRQGMEVTGDGELFSGRVDEILESGTSIRITDVQCDGALIPGAAVTLRVAVEYECPTDRSVVLYVGANTQEEHVFRLAREEYFPPENRGIYTFSFPAEVPEWGMRAYVNISEYPHEETWSPLASTEYPVQGPGGPAQAAGTLSLSNFTYSFDENSPIKSYNEGAVGGVDLNFTTTGPSNVQDVYIASWTEGSFSQEELDRQVLTMVDVWKQAGLGRSSRVPPFESGDTFPVDPEMRGKTLEVLLVGLDENGDAAGYATVAVAIP